MLPVSWGQDWQPLAPPAFNHQDSPSAPTRGLDGRGQWHGLSSSPRRSPGPRGTSCDPGLWDHPPPSPLQSLPGAPGEGRGSHFSPRALFSPRAPGERQGVQRTPVSGQRPSALEATPGSALRGVGGGREAEPHACSAAHTALLAERVGGWGLEAWDSSLGHSRLLRTQDPGPVQAPRGSQDAGSNRRVCLPPPSRPVSLPSLSAPPRALSVCLSVSADRPQGPAGGHSSSSPVLPLGLASPAFPGTLGEARSPVNPKDTPLRERPSEASYLGALCPEE